MWFPIKIFGLVFIYVFLCFIPFPLLAANSPYEELINLEKKVRTESIALNSLIKKVNPDYTEALESVKITKLKIVSNQCRVRETIQRSSQALYSPTINEEFKIINQDDNYYHIELGDGRDGWIHESCGQKITETVEQKKTESILSNADIGKYLDFSEMLFKKIEENKILADQIVEKNKINKNVNSYKKIVKYHSLAVGIYNKYLKDRKAYIVENFPLAKRFSGSTELLFGSSNHNQNFLNGSNIEYDESSRDFSILGDFILSKSSKIKFSFGSKSEVLRTPYKTTNYGVGFDYSGMKKLLLSTDINFNSYEDEVTVNNDYGRFQFNANANHRLSSKTNFIYRYSFLNNDYDTGDDRDYSIQKLSAIANLKLNNISKFVISMLANFENSDSEFHNFSSLLPSVSYQRKIGDKRTNLKFRYENLTYKDLELRDYDRMFLSYLINNRDINKRKITDLSISSKTFPNNEISDYYQLKTRFSSSTVGAMNERRTFSLYTNVYPNAEDNNFTDFRFDRNITSAMSSNFSAYYRLWHDLFNNEDGTNKSNKPSIIDLSAKFGFKVGPIRIGPSFGLHAILDFDADEILKRDGNLIRAGGVAEGIILSSSKLNVSIRAAYDYGFVYDTALTFGELEERHPTTLQFTSTISAPVMRNIELIGRINYYKINTDMDEKISVNPIEFTEQMSFQFGIRYRYN